jgi:F0F1-type ATP synthase alpha subunit
LIAATGGYLDDVTPSAVPAFERQLLERFRAEHPGLYREIDHTGELTGETREAMTETLTEYRAAWAKRSRAR